MKRTPTTVWLAPEALERLEEIQSRLRPCVARKRDVSPGKIIESLILEENALVSVEKSLLGIDFSRQKHS